MHIVIAILTGAAGLIWALYRLQNSGVDLNAFNPFYWMRRKAWERQLGTKPLHRLENSMEAAAVLVVAVAELEGGITRELKENVMGMFCAEFSLPESEATELYASSAYLLRDVMSMEAEVKHILAPSKERFEERHISLLLDMMNKVSQVEGAVTPEQASLIEVVRAELTVSNSTRPQW